MTQLCNAGYFDGPDCSYPAKERDDGTRSEVCAEHERAREEESSYGRPTHRYVWRDGELIEIDRKGAKVCLTS